MAQAPDEKTYMGIPFIEQLKGMKWGHIEGDIDVPYLTERDSFQKREQIFKSFSLIVLERRNLN